MIRLVKFELRKIFLRWPIFAALILFTLIDIVKINSVYRGTSYLAENNVWHTVYWEQYEEYQGEMTLDKIEALLSVYRPLEEMTADLTATTAHDVEGTFTGNIYSDKNLLNRYFVSPMEYLYTYRYSANEVAERAKANIEVYSERGNTYEMRKNALIVQLYSGRAITDFYYTEGFQLYLNYDFSTLLVLLLILYGLSQAFTVDKEREMNQLLLTAVNGGISTILAKIIAASLFVAAVSLWFSTVDFFSFHFVSEMFAAGSLPVYAVENLGEASVNLSLLQYSIASAACRALGFWVLGMVFLLAGEVGQHALIPFAVNGCLFLLAAAAGVVWSYSSAGWLKVWNPYSLLVNRVLFGKTEFINLFGTPVLTWQVALGAAVIFGAAAVFLVLLFGGKNELHKRAAR